MTGKQSVANSRTASVGNKDNAPRESLKPNPQED